jgi:hypothetical protein
MSPSYRFFWSTHWTKKEKIVFDLLSCFLQKLTRVICTHNDGLFTRTGHGYPFARQSSATLL